MIRNTLWFSQISTDWSVLKKFHDHFEQNMKNSLRETRHTRPHDVEDITSTYEYSMRIWEDETKKIYMKLQPADGPKPSTRFSPCAPRRRTIPLEGCPCA